MSVIKNKVYETSFIVMPRQCNYQYPMVFGGAFFSEMDLCAAACVSRALHDSECDAAVTHKYEGTFHAAAECGDLIFLRAEIVEARHKALVIVVEAQREKRAQRGQDRVADAKFVFVTKKNGEFAWHGLTLE